MQDAVIVSATRTAVGKAPNGKLRTVRPDDMAATVISEALRRAPGLDPSEIDDVIVGCVERLFDGVDRKEYAIAGNHGLF